MDTIVKVLNAKVQNGDAKTVVEALKQIDPNAEGETVTEVLKNMNIGGGGGGAFIANIVYGDSSTTLDKTYAEFKRAMLEGKTLYVRDDVSFNDPQYGYKEYKYYSVITLSQKFEGIQAGSVDSYVVYFDTYAYLSASEDGVLTLTD